MENTPKNQEPNKLIKRTWAEINLNNLILNYNKFEKLIKKDGGEPKKTRIMAVVKSDAYGHGVGYVARTLRDLGAEWFGVADVDEAVQLRDEGISEDILILGYTHPRAVSLLIEKNLTQTVFNSEYAAQLDGAVADLGGCKKLKIHVKVDTGMSRLGVFCQNEDEVEVDRAAKEILEISRFENLYSEGIFTHFACADEEDNEAVTLRQFSVFEMLIDRLKNKYNREFKIAHCCNTAGTIRFPEMHLDMVRIGIGLYGLYPDKWLESLIELSPVMELKSVVSMIKRVPANTALSYNHLYNTDAERVLATIPIGYADGYSRGLTGRSYVLVKGKPAPQVGRICMDQCLVDVTGIEGIKLGDTVTVFGEDNGAFLSVDRLAELVNTINYEIICLIGKRVPRVFRLDGKQIGIINYILSSRSL